MTKAIYYSNKMHKYYFCEKTVFGDFQAITVFGVEKLKAEDLDIKTDKNGKKYFLGELMKTVSEKGHVYYICKGPAPKKEEIKDEQESAE